MRVTSDHHVARVAAGAFAQTGREWVYRALMTVAGACSICAAKPQEPWAPTRLHVERGDQTLLVLCEKTGKLVRLEIETGQVKHESHLGIEPFALDHHPDGKRLYVSCRRGQEVVEIDATTLEPLRRFPLRGDPAGLAVSRDGQRLFVGLHALDRVAIIDLNTGAETGRRMVGNGPMDVRRVPQHAQIYVSHLLSNAVPADTPCRNEVTVLGEAAGRIIKRIMLGNANVGRQIAFTSDGSMGFLAVSRPKNLVPMLQVARGWVVTNGFAVLRPGCDDPPVQLLIDTPNRAFADPYAIVITPDDRKMYLTCAGVDTVLSIDIARVRKTIDEIRDGAHRHHADDLGLSRRYVTARIRVGANPQACAIDSQGRFLFVANRLDDTISVIDTTSDVVVRTISLHQPYESNRIARGERIFHSAARTFQNQFSCVSCHPDSGFDGLQYDMEPDDIGRNIIDNRNLRDVAGTGPFKWVGSNPDIGTQCGSRTAKWIVRTGWITSMQVVDLTAYIRSIQPTANPYFSPTGKLTPAQRRGKALFERTVTNSGSVIPELERCDFCHAGPKFTDGRRFDVGTAAPHDSHREFDTAHLNNIFESAPYLHDGRAATLESIWTVHNPDDRHGMSSDWTKRQLNDLVEYLKSLTSSEGES